MADTFPLGSIPPLSAWEGDILNLTITSKLEGASFSKRALPSPKGKISIDEKTGVLTYLPASEDREDFAVWIWARKGKSTESQKFVITPRPRLPSEFNFIEHVSKTPPNPESRSYINYSEQDAGEFRFNDIEEVGAGSRAKVMTKKVTVSGVRLILESKGPRNWLYEKLKDRTTLKELTIYADEVVVRCEMKLPGTDVNIYARTLSFDDSSGEIARLNTTPLAVQLASTKDDGLNGQKAGDVRLYVSKLETPGTAHRIIANGSQGQNAKEGEAGSHGENAARWTGKIRIDNKDFDFSGQFNDFVRKGYDGAPIGAHVYEEVFERGHRYERPRAHYNHFDKWPTNGKDPVKQPGRPGQGGDGGSIVTAFKDQLANRVEQDAGEAGKKAKTIDATHAGEPQKSMIYKILYKGGPTIVKFDPFNELETKPGKEVKGEPAKGAQPKKGQISNPSQGGTSFWLHPVSVRAFNAYVSDAMLTGHGKNVRELLNAYLDAVKVADLEAVKAAKAAGQEDKTPLIEWPVLRSELTALIQRIDGPYDYFGNPAGWVPMLSFQANTTLYQTELKVALRIMFLAYWVEKHQATTKKAESALKEAMERMRDETQQALDDYKVAQAKVARLDVQTEDIKQDIKDRQAELEGFVKRMKQATKDNLKVEHFWRSSAKLLGGVMELIPVGQPVLGAFGKTVTVLSDIDLDNPKDSLGDLAGAWKKVGSDKIAPKFSALFSKMTAAKEEEKKKDEKKEAFNKELEKKEIEKKVKEHMEEQQKAKDSIISAFSGFAVSEDDIKERLEKVVAQSPECKKLAEDIAALNKRKKAFAEELIAALQAIDVAANTILKNQLALIELRGQLDLTLDKLNVEALQYVQGLGQRARDRLLLYQYYILKSYHYLTLEPLPSMDFQAQKMFDAFAELLPKSSNGMLTEAEYNTVGVVFEKELREIAQKIIGFYQTHKGRSTGSFLLELNKNQLETLNSAVQRIEIDLLGKLNKQREDIRITKIGAESVGLAAPLPTRVANLGLEYRHDGLSRVRRGGRLFLFRSGEYRVAAEGSAAPQTMAAPETTSPDSLVGSSNETRSDKIYWSTDVSFNPKPKEGDPKLAWTDAKEDVEAKSLVRYLIGSTDSDSPWLSFRPSAWTNLTIKRSGDFKGKLDNLTLKVNYVYYPVNDEILSTVVVKVADGAQPLIRCNFPDANERADGQGSFVRTFDHTKRKRVTLTAPAHYGLRAFLGWRLGEDPDEDGGPGRTIDTSKLIREQSLLLKLDEVRDNLVEPIYDPTEYVPVNDKGEDWPVCPVGWVFDDWVFVNRTSSELTISSIYLPIPDQRVVAAVNEPQGTERVKLSFDRLKLLAGESAKLSVCTEQGGGTRVGKVNVAFEWRTNNRYIVGFDMTGLLAIFWKGVEERGWYPADEMFDVDRTNRVIAFARPPQ